MNIIYDARWLGRTGIGRYAEELLTQLQQLDHENEYHVLLLPEQYDTWRPVSPNFHPVRTTCEVYTWQEQLLLGRQIAALKPDLVHFTSFNLPIFYSGRFITTIHDLTLVHYKNNHGSGLKKLVYEIKYWVMRGIMRVVTRRAERILVPSEFTKQDVMRQYHVAAERLVVTHEAVGAAYGQPEAFKERVLPDHFIMYLGNMYPYKNIGRLIEAFARTEARQNGTKLILAGRTKYFEDQHKALAEKLGLAQDVIFTGRVTDGEAATLYQKTSLFVFPSLYEGFGLMGLEAMSLGTPVLSSNASCLPEIHGDAAEYFDPNDTDDMARHIDALLANPQRLEELRQAGYKRVKEFSWSKMARETLDVYQAALKR